MKKHLTIVLAVITALCLVSCNLNDLGDKMLELKQNVFFPAQASEETVTEKVEEVVAGLGGIEISSEEVFSQMATFSKNAIDEILALGESNPLSQKALIEQLAETQAFTDAQIVEGFINGIYGKTLQGELNVQNLLDAAKNDDKTEYEAIAAKIDEQIPGATDLIVFIVGDLVDEAITVRDVIVAGMISDVVSSMISEEFSSEAIGTLVTDVKVLGLLIPEVEESINEALDVVLSELDSMEI